MIINCMTLLEIAQKIGNFPTYQETFAQTTLKILEVLCNCLKIKRVTFWQIHDSDCQIIAGIPVGAHGIWKRDSISNHLDIEYIVNSKNYIHLIENPQTNPLTVYFRKIIEHNEINAILYILIAGEIKSLIVIDAINEKKTFQYEEIELCRIAGRLIAAKIVSYDFFLETLWKEINWICIQDLRHQLMNPVQVIGGFGKRIAKEIKKANEEGRVVTLLEQEKLLKQVEAMEQGAIRIEQIILNSS